MLVNITGSYCVECDHFKQYYGLNYNGEYERINRGFCGSSKKDTRPGNKCRKYQERSNIAWQPKVNTAEVGLS